MALLTNRPRSATVQAATSGEILRLERSHFLDLIHQEPSVLLVIAATLSHRLAEGQTHSLMPAPPLQDTATPHAPRTPQRRGPWRALLGGGLAVGVLLGSWLWPLPTGLTAAGWYALVTLVAAVPLLAFETLPDGIIALLLAGTWVVGGALPASVALSGFASPSWVLVVSVLALGAAVASSGLLYRLALWIVAHTGGGFVGQVLTLGLAGVLLGPTVPNATVRVTIIAPILTELVEVWGYAPQSRPAAGLAMATLIGFGQMVAVFLTSSTTAVLVFAVLPPATQAELTWGTWAVRAAPINGCLLLGLLTAIIWLYRPRTAREQGTQGAPGTLRVQRALLGRPSRHERMALVVGLGLVLGFTTEGLHGIHPGWLAVLALVLLASTRTVTPATLQALNWNFALLFGLLASMPTVFARTQVDHWLATTVMHAVGALTSTPVLFVAILTLLCFAISLVLRWQAAAPLLTITLVPVAGAAGLTPLFVGLLALIACNGFFLPYQSTTYLALYHGTGGQLFTHAQARPAAVAYGIVVLMALCVSIALWG
jgi:di/tricarboxylate transporter